MFIERSFGWETVLYWYLVIILEYFKPHAPHPYSWLGSALLGLEVKLIIV